MSPWTPPPRRAIWRVARFFGRWSLRIGVGGLLLAAPAGWYGYQWLDREILSTLTQTFDKNAVFRFPCSVQVFAADNTRVDQFYLERRVWVPIAELPYSFEERLLTLSIKGLSKLTVLVPEAHDLVLMKVARGEAHDLDAIEDIHRAAPLDFDTLLARYRETTPQVMGSKEMHRLNFLAAVARLFGAEKADEADKRPVGSLTNPAPRK